jgi:hypothetical protein
MEVKFLKRAVALKLMRSLDKDMLTGSNMEVAKRLKMVLLDDPFDNK